MGHDGELLINSRKIILEKKVHQAGIREVTFDSGEAAICIEVADTGPGIDPQDKAKIFELFYTTKAVGEGTGLGLAVTHNIINLHHGSITIDNRPQGGASVGILFKIKPGQTP